MPETKYIDGEKYSLHGTTHSQLTADKQKILLKRGGYSVRLIRHESLIKIFRRRL